MYLLYYNKQCSDCVKQAETTKSLDWFKRFEFSTEISPVGELSPGKIVVVDKEKGKMFTGGYATRKICLNIPVYFIVGLLLFLPPVFKAMNKNKAGCNGESCEIKKV